MSATSSAVVRAVRPVGRPLFNLAFVLASLVGLWLLVLHLADVSPLVTRKPQDVYEFLFVDRKAPANRTAVLSPLWQTLLDAGIGFVAGLGAAIAIATATYLSRGVEAATMPVAMLVRTVPLVALAPIITLLLGNGLATVAVMSGIVVLFPALVTIAFGLRSVTPQMSDVVHVYGGGTWAVLRRVAYPSAVPSVFAAIRISVPGAITGALIAEFYTTPDSVGKAINQGLALYQYDLVWSLLVVLTLASVLLYAVAQLLEGLVLARFGLAAQRS
ncbi:ABC transporter permease subunit [Nocardioides sp. TRM66260-LWL]|uniref:ABC transporter permease n=1 Tax=Nocardioides sp. TRM66260-LWL TaxID=2874478 RepID=UPI001CC49724|nr:ABC transporter permease subunit [Nocardioides sp. TRM66260-LWL]MBZ5734666.1 ABC transporter permease subunit [Nocardioides sp. TRM66260-LWL]